MTFLHPDFFVWMVPPVAALFYFWQTQKPVENRWMEDETLRRLRAPAITMGLKERNLLFLIASVLLIAAMAQPVIPESAGDEKGRIVIAVQTGAESEAEARRVKDLALETMGMLAGNDMGVLAFGAEVYRVAPVSEDYAILSLLVRGLPRTGEKADISAPLTVLAGMKNIDIGVVVSAEPFESGSGDIVVLNAPEDIGGVVARVSKIREAQRLGNHIPLFPYPLGLAMILIWIALSSMSKRRSVGVAALAALIAAAHPAAVEAGITDFVLLHEAREAYQKGDYAESAVLYGRYQQDHDTPQVRYNRANALYKAGRYEQAAYWYRQVYTDDPELEQRRRHNLAQSLKRLAVQPGTGGKEGLNGKTDETTRRREQARSEIPGFTTRLYRLD